KDRERFSDSVDKNEVGGKNLIPNSNDFKSRYLPRNSSEVTFEESYTVEEWSTNEATRIHITGGTDNHRAGATIGNIPKNTEMVHSIYVKNLSEETFTLRFNTEFGGSTGIKIEPLEIKRLVVTGVGRKKYDFVQLHIFTNDHMNDIEFAVWREKLELGNKATDWSPALEDFETYDDYIMGFVNSGKFQLEKDGIYGLADDIHIDYQKYVFEENNFSVYNAGNVEIEPESMYINIIVSGLNGEIEIKNLTTGQLFKLEKPFKGI